MESQRCGLDYCDEGACGMDVRGECGWADNNPAPDSVRAKLHAGEYVLTADYVRRMVDTVHRGHREEWKGGAS